MQQRMQPAKTFRDLSPDEVKARGYPPGSYQVGPDNKISPVRNGPDTVFDMGGGTNKQIYDSMQESAISARSAVNGLYSLTKAREALAGGGFFGQFADERLAFAKLGEFLGMDNADAIQNTETFRSAIAPQVAALMKATVGSTQISNADREFAEKAAGGSISLDEGSITRLLDIMERASSVAIQGHMRRLDTVYPSDNPEYARERALFGVDYNDPNTPPADYPNAKKASDGKWYVPDPANPGKYLVVEE
jgi:hypothetical protein